MTDSSRASFTGRVVVVTGAAMGIGAATAELFARRGATVCALDIDDEQLANRARGWAAAALNVWTYVVNVRLASSVDGAFDAIEADHGRLDVLVNVAGIVRYGRVDELIEDDWDAVIETNVKSIFLTTRRAISLMRRAGGGSIVNVASVQAMASQQRVAAYSASKGAVVSLTRSLALDHASDGVRVNCVLPGSVETPMLRFGAETFRPDSPADAMKEWGAAHPLGFLAQPIDIAEVIAFLASDEARVITGAPVLADEGLLARLAV